MISGWIQKIPGLNTTKEITVKPRETITLFESITKNWSVLANDYNNIASFGLTPVYNDRIGFCSFGINRQINEDSFSWTWTG